ncbi:hypothetical protein CHARACLAT_013604 [Characodon lateralis]|uniref:Uncharacterized protein n=1 Tax=Characodon lateralis TaxID=208331 RepID=A0ABU7D1C7_9TELE|nr:hypothetical protein [Characodon lateralis]
MLIWESQCSVLRMITSLLEDRDPLYWTFCYKMTQTKLSGSISSSSVCYERSRVHQQMDCLNTQLPFIPLCFQTEAAVRVTVMLEKTGSKISQHVYRSFATL